jgi:FlaA1/EpsC-like NDP-sugar epimerase
VPIFLEQRRHGTINITDERMTRFWITLEQGANFVIDCIGKMQGGEIFVPKIPSMRVIDMADAIAPNVKKKVVGIRPGEKLSETLLTEEMAEHALEFDDCFVIEPEHPFWKKDNLKGGKPLPPNTRYNSESNDTWLTNDELKTMIKEL